LSDSPKPHPAIRDFTQEQWDEMIDKLMGFTYKYFKARFEGNIKEAQTLDGSTYEDIAHDIVLRVLQGTRRWNPDKDGELLPYMAGQVKSLVSHGFDSWSARNVGSMSEREDEKPLFVNEIVNDQTQTAETSQLAPNTFTSKRKLDEIEEREITNEDQSKNIQSTTFPNPEFVLIGHELQVERERLHDTVLEAVAQTNDDDLWSLVEAYLDESGEYKPGEIAARLGISTTEFHNLRKRLVRCVQKHHSEQSSGTGG